MFLFRFGCVWEPKIDQNCFQNRSKNRFGYEVASNTTSGSIFGPILVDFWTNFGQFRFQNRSKFDLGGEVAPETPSRSIFGQFLEDFWTNFDKFGFQN